MIVLEGRPALSAFRLERLQTRLVAHFPGLRIEQARHVFVVQPRAGREPDRERLARILDAVGTTSPQEAPGSVIVLPRLGTHSPWATKATEIVQGAGLEVERVERGLWFTLAPADAADL